MFDLTAILNIPDLEPSEIQMGLTKGGYAKLIARGETKDGKKIHPSIIKRDVKLSSVASNPSINSVVGKPLTKDSLSSANRQVKGGKVVKGQSPDKRNSKQVFIADYHDTKTKTNLTSLLSSLEKKGTPAIYSENSNRVVSLNKDGKKVTIYKQTKDGFKRDEGSSSTATSNLWENVVSMEYSSNKKFGAHNNATEEWVNNRTAKRDQEGQAKRKQKESDDAARIQSETSRNKILNEIDSVPLKGKKGDVKLRFQGDDGSVETDSVKATNYPVGLSVYRNVKPFKNNQGVRLQENDYGMAQTNTGLSLGLKFATLDDAKRAVKAMTKNGVDFTKDIEKDKDSKKKAGKILKFLRDRGASSLGL